jgi:hypothetical protein
VSGNTEFAFDNSLVSLIAAMSMEFAWRKISSSAFLLKIEFAFHANIRKLLFTVNGKGNVSLYQRPSPVWR